VVNRRLVLTLWAEVVTARWLRPDRVVVEAARGHKLLLSTGTGTTPETTLKNQRAMVQAALAE